MPSVMKMERINPTYRGTDGKLYQKITQAEALENTEAIHGSADDKPAWFVPIVATAKEEPVK